MDRVPCPKCGRNLAPCGELVVEGRSTNVYTCDECLLDVTFMGEQTQIPLTFCMNRKGEPVDPVNPDIPLVF